MLSLSLSLYYFQEYHPQGLQETNGGIHPIVQRENTSGLFFFLPAEALQTPIVHEVSNCSRVRLQSPKAAHIERWFYCWFIYFVFSPKAQTHNKAQSTFILWDCTLILPPPLCAHPFLCLFLGMTIPKCWVMVEPIGWQQSCSPNLCFFFSFSLTYSERMRFPPSAFVHAK